jgi:uncharacterized protein
MPVGRPERRVTKDFYRLQKRANLVLAGLISLTTVSLATTGAPTSRTKASRHPVIPSRILLTFASSVPPPDSSFIHASVYTCNQMASAFLTAEWRKLAMANFSVDEKVLEPYVPRYTEIDVWQGTCYVSLVGFMFMNTKVRGFTIPFHSNFEEVNLRFYVRYREKTEWKRGVVFIREIVPRYGLSFVAKAFYNEPYVTMPMDHLWSTSKETLSVQYRWKKGRWNSLKVLADFTPRELTENSEEEFITEHFWGYTRISSSQVAEYGVEHPRWKVYPVRDHWIDVDFAKVYGDNFGFLQAEKPVSVFLAEGSEIVVRSGRKI